MKEMSTKKLLGIAGLAWLFDAMDVGILSFIIAALKEDWNLTAEQMSWIGSINSIGMAVGAFFLRSFVRQNWQKNCLYYHIIVIFDRQRSVGFYNHISGIFAVKIFYRHGAGR